MTREHKIDTSGATIRVVESGKEEGFPVVLLHGYPESLEAWRLVAPLLAAEHRVVALDLRGYGQSSRPMEKSELDMGTMAEDVRAVMDRLGLERAFIAGHDRGGHVARRFGLLYPDRVEGLCLIDIAPVEYIYDEMSAAQAAKKFWHWVWLTTTEEPEMLVAGREKEFLEDKFKHSAGLLEKLRADGAWPVYEKAFRDGGMRAMFNNYRATFELDLPYFRTLRKAGKKLEAPTMLLWGETGNLEGLPVKEIWRQVAADIRETHQLAGCGHFVPEEKGEETAELIERFCGSVRARALTSG
jgi:haloacetate dehalogenase